MTILDEAAIKRLTANAAAVRAFPFLKAKLSGTHGCCGRMAKGQPDAASIKQAIARLSTEQQKAILRYVGMTQARMIYRAENKTQVCMMG